MRANCKSITFVGIALVAGTITAYWPVFRCEFVSLDDPMYVNQNPHVLGGLTRSGWQYAFTTFDSFNWHPLTWLSLELDTSLWGKAPLGYHVTNLILHVVNVVLLFATLHLLTGSVYRSGFVAGLFAVHPLHVESVAWISERKDVLSTLFLLLTVLAYVRYAARPKVTRYLLVAAMLVLGLLSKPMLVTLPILLLLLDWWPLCRLKGGPVDDCNHRFPQCRLRDLIAEKIFLLFLAFADGLATIAAQRSAMKVMEDLPFSFRLANVLNAYAWYLQKTFAPIDLIAFYPHPERSLSWQSIAFGLVLTCGLTAWAFWPSRLRRQPHLSVGWAWFVVSLLPVIGLLQVGGQAYADRYAYIPHIGLFVMIVWEVHRCLVAVRGGRAILIVLAVASLIACGRLTQLQVEYWKNSDALWTHALDVDAENGFAHAHLADLRFSEGDYERAIDHLERGLRLKRAGYVANAYGMWGRALIELGRSDEAEVKFLEALKVDRNHEVSLEQLSKLLQKQGRSAEATRYSDRYAVVKARNLENQPESAESQMLLGFSKAKKGEIRQSLVHFEKAAELAPRSATVRYNLALVQMQLNRVDDAKRNLMKAIEFDAKLGVAHRELATILEAEKDIPGAIQHLREAVRLNPGDAKIKSRLDKLTNR